jgi:hypothetical protein
MSAQVAVGFQPEIQKAGQSHSELRDNTHPGLASWKNFQVVRAMLSEPITLFSHVTAPPTRTSPMYMSCKVYFLCRHCTKFCCAVLFRERENKTGSGYRYRLLLVPIKDSFVCGRVCLVAWSFGIAHVAIKYKPIVVVQEESASKTFNAIGVTYSKVRLNINDCSVKHWCCCNSSGIVDNNVDSPGD